MYKYYFGNYVGDCNIQKSIRIDKDTYEIIKSVAPGCSFSEQLRRLVHEYRFLKENKPGKK